MYVQCRLGALGYRYSGSASTYNCFLSVVKFVVSHQCYPPPSPPVRCQDLRINILYFILLLSLTTYSQECNQEWQERIYLFPGMSNSSQVDKQPWSPAARSPAARSPATRSPATRSPAAVQPRTWGSHGPGAATDMGQPRTWSSHGPGAATDMEQPRTWSSYSLGPVKEGR